MPLPRKRIEINLDPETGSKAIYSKKYNEFYIVRKNSNRVEVISMAEYKMIDELFKKLNNEPISKKQE